MTPDDLIPLKEACKLVTSPRTNRRVHVNTMRRWALSGRLRYWKCGPWLFVSRAEVLALMVLAP